MATKRGRSERMDPAAGAEVPGKSKGKLGKAAAKVKKAVAKPLRRPAGKADGTRKAAAPKRKPARLRESAEQRQRRAMEILRRLKREYPDAHCALDHTNAYELITATILSAQCTDARVNQVTPALFKAFPTPHDLAGAKQEHLEDLIKSTGFFRNKAKSLLGMASALVERHEGEVPNEMASLVELPGVGRKTANVVLGNAFGMNEGIVVDTHVTRVSGRLALTAETDAVKIEQDLIALMPREDWTLVSHLFIDHGRAICKAPTPRCEVCFLTDLCPSSRV